MNVDFRVLPVNEQVQEADEILEKKNSAENIHCRIKFILTPRAAAGISLSFLFLPTWQKRGERIMIGFSSAQLYSLLEPFRLFSSLCPWKAFVASAEASALRMLLSLAAGWIAEDALESMSAAAVTSATT